jgi:hypothetical protein
MSYSAAIGAFSLGLVGLVKGYEWFGVGGALVIGALAAGIGAAIGAIVPQLLRTALWLGAIGLPIVLVLGIILLTWGFKF